MADLRPEKRRSLRKTFFSRYLMFTLVPLTIVAVVFLLQYKKTVESQMQDRLTAHIRKVESVFTKERTEIDKFVEFSVADKKVTSYLSSLDSKRFREAFYSKILQYKTVKATAYTHGGQVFALYDQGFQSIHGQKDLPSSLMETLENQKLYSRVRFTRGRLARGQFSEGKSKTYLNLSVIKAVPGFQGKTIGYIEASLPLNKAGVAKLASQTAAEIFFFNRKGQVLVSTLPGPSVESSGIGRRFLKRESRYFENRINGTPYALVSTVLQWGNRQFLVGMGVDSSEGKVSIRNVALVIALAYGCFLLFSFVMSLFFLREFVSPIEKLTHAMDAMKHSRDVVYVQSSSNTELGQLIANFNEMSLTIHESDSKLKKQVKLLEKANNKIQKAQGQLIQSTKLASLGELVAGIAHELNNPIGFIYSNMEHLKDYSQSLISLVEEAQVGGDLSKENLEKIDFDYIKKDFPKLVKSCEEGAIRAKEIVIGLRNFSRTDDEFREGFDVNEGIESTLKLLKGAIDSKVTVKTHLQLVPSLYCNGNQIKQVFMNIINNGLQALSGEGTLTIQSGLSSGKDFIEIRIADDGQGMPDHVKDKIFDPFFTTKEIGQGTGLGLSISYGIVQSHHGELQVKSELGKGSEFLIRLPVNHNG